MAGRAEAKKEARIVSAKAQEKLFTRPAIAASVPQSPVALIGNYALERYFADSLSNRSSSPFQRAAIVWLPCPRVFSLKGSTTARPFATRLISRSRIPSSGGL